MSKHYDFMDPARPVTGTTLPTRASGVSFVVTGNPVSLKNRRQLFRNVRSGKTILARAKACMKYMDDFHLQVPVDYRNLRLGSLREPLRMICTVFYSSRRSDLDVSAILDGLQAAGVIANDRFVIEQHLYAEVDAKTPRTEITVEYI